MNANGKSLWDMIKDADFNTKEEKMNTLEAMEKAKDNPGVKYTSRNMDIEYDKQNELWTMYDHATNEDIYVANYTGFEQGKPKVKEGQWYQETGSEQYFKVININQNETADVAYLSSGSKAMDVPFTDISGDSLITDERDVIFLENGRKPGAFKNGDILIQNHSISDEAKTIILARSDGELRYKQELICFREHRADWKGEK